MRAQVLVIMATRQEDQSLVLDACETHALGLDGYKALLSHQSIPSPKFIPSFGWHPWFSHHLYDDLIRPPAYVKESEGSPEFKTLHYNNVLTGPRPTQDFVASQPEPRSLSSYIEATRWNLRQHPLALLGEVGLDRTFRPPEPWTDEGMKARDSKLTPGGREGRNLSKHHVQMDHERAVLLAQLRLAGEMQRPASIHGVAAHGVLYDTLAESWRGFERTVVSKSEQRRRMEAALSSDDLEPRLIAEVDHEEKQSIQGPFPPRICLHSYSGSAEQLKQWFHPTNPLEVWVSFSSMINFPEGNNRSVDAVKAVPADRLLIESDLHQAGPEMDARLEEVGRRICKIREWTSEAGLRTLGQNWRAFVLGM